MPRREVRIRPNGPKAIEVILLNGCYSTESERKGLVNELLAGTNPEPTRLECIANLLRSHEGRKRFGKDLDRAFQKLALWAEPKDCLCVYSVLPPDLRVGRRALLKKICALGRALVDDAGYRDKFSGLYVDEHERKLLLSALGQKVLVDRLLRPRNQGPSVWLAVG